MRKWTILSIAVIAAAALDQSTKHWVISSLSPHQTIQPIPTLAPFFQLTRSTNTGAAFGIFPMAGDLFLLLACAIIAYLLWLLRAAPPSARLLPTAIGIVIGGAIGNVIDRLQYGHVIDFIHYQIPGLISNVSNIADHAIVFGTLLIIAESFWRERQSNKQSATDQPDAKP